MRDETLLADVQVRLEWASHRRWSPGEAIHGSHPAAPALFLVAHGVLRVDLADGSSWRAPAGAVLLLPGGLRRERIAAAGAGDGADWLSLGLRPRLYGRLPVDGPFARTRLWEPDAATGGRLLRWAGEAAELFADEANAGRAAAEGLAKAVFALCWREAGDEDTAAVAPGAPDWLLRALRRAAEHPETTLGALCDGAAVSPAHLRRTFHRYVGVSPQAYLTDRRLERARELLAATDLLVAAVAERVGFDSASHFTRLFTARFGASPARYRQQSRTQQV
jgi:AraC-like DNA-binding protein